MFATDQLAARPRGDGVHCVDPAENVSVKIVVPRCAVTGITVIPFVTPGAETVMFATLLPLANPAVAGVSVSGPGAGADDGVGTNHPLSLLAIHGIAPVPTFETCRFTGGGDDPTGLKRSIVNGVTASVAEDKEAVTGITKGAFMLPGEYMVMLPE